MDETVTVRDVLDGTFVGVGEGDAVSGAAALLHQEDTDSAVVLRGEEPIGLLRTADIVALVGEGETPSATTVDEIMVDPTPTVRATDRLGSARTAIAGSETRRALVRDEDGVAGVLSPVDLLVADASLDPPEVPPTDGSALQSGEYASQGLCEICGALSSDLIDRNGQLVCADCREL